MDLQVSVHFLFVMIFCYEPRGLIDRIVACDRSLGQNDIFKYVLIV
jgi:hypothetical protein